MEIEKLRYLIIDDMATQRAIYNRMLTSMGVTSTAGVGTAAQAWEMLTLAAAAGKPYEMVICDLHLPDMSGIELAKKCRADAAYKNVGFLILTSETEVNKVIEAMTAGVDNYAIKPIDATAFREKLTNIIKKRFGGK